MAFIFSPDKILPPLGQSYSTEAPSSYQLKSFSSTKAENCQSKETLNPSAPRNIEDYSGADALATSTAMNTERAYYHCGDFSI